MKILLLAFVVLFPVVAHAQDPKPATKDAIDLYTKAMALNTKIAESRTKLEKRLAKDEALLQGYSDEWATIIKQNCLDSDGKPIPQGCRYDPSMKAFVPLQAPKPIPTSAPKAPETK